MPKLNLTKFEISMIHDYLVKQRDNEFYPEEKNYIDQLCNKLLELI